MTGTTVRERVPDWVVRQADQLELIDSSPEQLRRRMMHGNIYPAEKVPEALTHFFRTENLVGLRELALRFVADETEEELLDYLRDRQPRGCGRRRERIMVAVTGAPGDRRRDPPGRPHLGPHEGRPARRARDGGRTRRRRERPDGPSTPCTSWPTTSGPHWHEIAGATTRPGPRRLRQRAPGHPDRARSSRRSRWEELTKGSVVQRVLRFASKAASTCTSSPAATRTPTTGRTTGGVEHSE